MQNFFEYFDLPCQFTVNNNLLEAKYYELQNKYHPDSYNKVAITDFPTGNPIEKINEAYQVLSNDLSRAVYLLKLNKIDITSEDCCVKVSVAELANIFLLQEEIEENKQNSIKLRQMLVDIDIETNKLVAESMQIYQSNIEESAKKLIIARYLFNNKQKIKRYIGKI
jgi:molecular chaperone HscB